MAANTERQSSAARALIIPPAPHYEVTRFEVEEIGDALFVAKEYGRPGNRGRYYEHHSVGPRGGTKMMSSGFYNAAEVA